jgi:hypothetical protein
MQELEGQGVDARLAEGAPLDGGSTREQLEVEASPLTRWTSDGSMMEELLRTFTYAVPWQRCRHIPPRALDAEEEMRPYPRAQALSAMSRPGTPAVVAAAAVSQAQASSSLAKDMSISSALMALIAQQQEETAAAERQHEVQRASLQDWKIGGGRTGVDTRAQGRQAVGKCTGCLPPVTGRLCHAAGRGTPGRQRSHAGHGATAHDGARHAGC